MTTPTTQPGEGPRYVTTADLEALEGRLIDRASKQELRLTKEISTAFWRQLLWLGGIVIVFGVAILNQVNAILAKLP